MAIKLKKTAFIKGRITEKEKEELNIKGFKVVNAKFAPEKLKDGDILHETEEYKAKTKAKK